MHHNVPPVDIKFKEGNKIWNGLKDMKNFKTINFENVEEINFSLNLYKVVRALFGHRRPLLVEKPRKVFPIRAVIVRCGYRNAQTSLICAIQYESKMDPALSDDALS
ncbi:hypothetical protein AVEN_209939-1 [Araneus ventricosus]|uniref:Uncharacterized protein n=1 Tax=Araneus ventricosus TaxID=182803 RepID=A0A4Y2DES9_ARAVE|nr:hypothetical protein AVEN_209939-1 [Araneus ventricosus]